MSKTKKPKRSAKANRSTAKANAAPNGGGTAMAAPLALSDDGALGPCDADDLVDFDRDATRQSYGLLHGQWWLDSQGVVAQLPFGHGLGYTEFRIGKTGAADAHVDVELKNTGPRPGRGVVFVFGTVPDSRYERPPRRLVGFAGARLEPGESRSLQISIDLGQLDLRVDGRWLREELPVRLSVGFDAARAVEIR